MKSLIEKLLEVNNEGKGISFDPYYDVKNQLFNKIFVAKEYNFYSKLVRLFEEDCKKLKERLGDSWYMNELARYMLYRKYNIKEVRAKCDNFPISECDSSAYSMKYVFKIEENKERMKNLPWLTIEKNGKRTFFADTMTPAWTVIRSLIEYCIMAQKNEIFDEDRYEDLKGNEIFNFKIPDEELMRVTEKISNEIGTNSYEVALCEYIIENIVSIIEMFNKCLGDTEELKRFITLTHSGSGCNFCIVPRELLNRSRDPYINRMIAPGIELPNAGRLWDLGDIPFLFIHRWYLLNHGKEINANKYIESQDIPLKILAKLKRENREVKNIKLWLNYYMKDGGWDAFIEDYHFESYVMSKDEPSNVLLEELESVDKSYSKKYGFPLELFKGHLYKYDFSDGIENAKPYAVYNGDSVDEDFPLIGYVNGVEDFKQVFRNFKITSEGRRSKLI